MLKEMLRNSDLPTRPDIACGRASIDVDLTCVVVLEILEKTILKNDSPRHERRVQPRDVDARMLERVRDGLHVEEHGARQRHHVLAQLPERQVRERVTNICEAT